MVLRRWFAVAIMLAAVVWAAIARAEIRIGVAGPMTGAQSWGGEQFQRGAQMAGRRSSLGEDVELIVGDDLCDPYQAVALARKLFSDGVVFVAGHLCSHSSIPASKIYEEARILQITADSANAKLTGEGGPNVFRVCGRDN
jgi:branched-chain amino acid transport system substrate-binding protein